jgi:hypothetical protein
MENSEQKNLGAGDNIRPISINTLDLISIIDIETNGIAGKILEIGVLRITKNFVIVEELEVRTNVAWPLVHPTHTPAQKPLGLYTEAEAIQIMRNAIDRDVVFGYNLEYLRKLCGKFGYVLYKAVDMREHMAKKYKRDMLSLNSCALLWNIEEIDPCTALGDCATIYELMQKESA